MKRKRIYILGLAVLLSACSTATAPPTTETVLLPDTVPEPSLSSDPFMSLDEPADAVAGGTATPSTTPPATDSFLAEPTPPASAPSSELPSPAGTDKPASAAAGTPAATQERDVYEDYAEYQERMRTRSKAESEYNRRSMFPHEDGAFQLGFEYGHKVFNQLDFDPGPGQRQFDTMAGVLSFHYFPLRSFSYGRLGVGALGGGYWTNYEYTTAAGLADSSRKLSMYSYGGRLTYEFHYFIGQIVVPYGFYGYDQVSMRNFTMAGINLNYPARKFASQYYGGGLHFNLNRLESSAASTGLARAGIRKYYLSYSFQQRTENTGVGHFLGLRFEY